ncbi:FecR family protein [Chitinophaga sp. sic0106]|uniref:FecR family protein n=1 Tax=Chitinophaga sp. sic0106 TaxID=2854785 RepID=UPI001C48401F|nr:FecR family protein [Chitinophaga sp. sic0106]MBV7529254.1 FecR family protein [Chitinophaga sp. sic0106]
MEHLRMTKEELILLTEKIVSGTATDAELMQYNRVFNAFSRQETWDEHTLGNKAEIEAAIRLRLEDALRKPAATPVIGWYKWAAAAAVVVIISVSAILLRPREVRLAPQAERFRNDIPAPSGNHAVLTLGNGQQILLDSAGNGTIAVQGGVNIAKTADGQIAYSGAGATVSTNTITLPPGSRALKIVLADGTKVWIDAGSSFTYPTTFTGKTRAVNITGQAYFEVAQNSNMPFTVSTTNKSYSVDVLGTSFNIRVYADESNIKLTLVDGAVKFNTNTVSKLMKPGEQATASDNGTIQLTTNADLTAATAWKDGLFYYNGSDINTIMSELQRYYNLDVVYQANVRDSFVAKIPRDVPISQLLNLLEMTNLVHFRIEGRKVTVMK